MHNETWAVFTGSITLHHEDDFSKWQCYQGISGTDIHVATNFWEINACFECPAGKM